MTQRDLYAGLILLHILHHAAKETIYGSEISEELAHHGYDISPGTLYPMLHAMESKGIYSPPLNKTAAAKFVFIPSRMKGDSLSKMRKSK